MDNSILVPQWAFIELEKPTRNGLVYSIVNNKNLSSFENLSSYENLSSFENLSDPLYLSTFEVWREWVTDSVTNGCKSLSCYSQLINKAKNVL